ncbi:MAG: DUF4430 domain-containing protein [Clostridia bacterium]|nr:DUF4430 domain-containing protein [Clostridia bacterium]
MKKLTVIMLALVMLMSFAACADKANTPTDTNTTAPENTVNQAVGSESEEKTSFKFTVIGLDGAEKEYTVKTDKDTVGAALLAEGLIAGEEGPYGLYVKTVDGTTLDYDKDGKYWAFYIDGEYAMSGVDATEIDEGKTYTFKAE